MTRTIPACKQPSPEQPGPYGSYRVTRVPGTAAQRDGEGRERDQEGLPRAVSPPGWSFPPLSGVSKRFCLPWVAACPSQALTESQSSAGRKLTNKRRRKKGAKTPEEKEGREGQGG